MRAPGLRGQVLTLAVLPVLTLALALAHCGLGLPGGPAARPGPGSGLLLAALTAATGLALGLALTVLRLARGLARERDQALRQGEAYADLVARVSHDARIPLDGILGYAGLLGQTPLDPRQREHLVSVERAARTLLDLVNELLEFARKEHREPVAPRVEFHLAARIEETLELFAPTAHRKGLELAAYLAPEVPSHVRGDPVRLAQALANLMSNAVKFTDAGIVSVEVTRPARAGQGGLRVSVSDSGGGMSRAEQARLTRAAAPGQGDGLGADSGLGLAITRSLVERMQGQLQVRSARGKGTTVTLTLPFEPAAGAEQPADARLAGRRAVVVEANPASRRALVSVLRGWDMEVTEVAEPAAVAGPGEAAGAPDFALIGLPPGQPPPPRLREALEPLARLARHPPIVLAAPGEARDGALASAAPAAVLLDKPLRREQLRATLRRLLGGEPPIAERSPPAGVGRPDPPGLPPGTRVLLAEDNPVSHQLVRTLLEAHGARVTSATNGREALAHLLGERFDLALMDLHLPEIDGAEVTARVRAVEREGQRTPIVALTADLLDEARRYALGVGVDDWLTKPVDEAALLRVARRWVRPSQAAATGAAGQPGDPSPGAPPVLDRGAALAAAGGQGALADELLGILLAELSGQQARIARALAAADLAEVAEVAHTLAGSAAYCGAAALERAARELLQAARARHLEATAASVLALEHEAGRLVAAAARYLAGAGDSQATAPPSGRGPG